MRAKRGQQLLLIMLGVCCVVAGCSTTGPMTRGVPQVCFSGHCYAVELVATPAQRAQGLMGRESLPDRHGMLFVFPVLSRDPFWMKNMRFPIDIIWMDENRQVVQLRTNVPPCLEDPCEVYPAIKEALYVLEVAVGEAGKRNILVGNAAEFRGIQR